MRYELTDDEWPLAGAVVSPRPQFERRHIHSHPHIEGFRMRLSTGVLRLFAP
jgi:hypothetical protein